MGDHDLASRDGGALVLPSRYQAVIFDMDGLLFDSEPAWARAEADLLARHGHVFTEADRVATMGRSIDESIAIYAGRIGLPRERQPAMRREFVDLARLAFAGVSPRAGSLELVRALRHHVKLGLASNSDRLLVDAALSAAGLTGAFDATTCADEVAHPKPAPDVYLATCERLQVAPADALAFEDSAVGLQAAAAAGMTCVAVPSSPTVDVSLADIVIGSLTEVVVVGLKPAPGDLPLDA